MTGCRRNLQRGEVRQQPERGSLLSRSSYLGKELDHSVRYLITNPTGLEIIDLHQSTVIFSSRVSEHFLILCSWVTGTKILLQSKQLTARANLRLLAYCTARPPLSLVFNCVQI